MTDIPANISVANTTLEELVGAINQHFQASRELETVVDALTFSPGELRGYLNGLQVTYVNGYTLDIGVGVATDSAETILIKNQSTLRKRLDVVFTAGTNQGGLQSGTRQSNTTYHVYLIQNPTSSAVDILYSTHNTTPTMPTGFTKNRRIFSFVTDSNADIIPFIQIGDTVLYKTPVLDINTSTLGTLHTTYTLTVPNGIDVLANFNVRVNHNSGNAGVYFQHMDQDNLAPSSTVTPLAHMWGDAQTVNGVFPFSFYVKSGQIKVSSSLNNTLLKLATVGYVDTRGR